MAFIQCYFRSDVLQMQTQMWVLLPQSACVNRRRNKPIPTLYLLHGLSDEHTIWMRRTSIERYAEDAGLAVVMPTTYRGFYTDMAAGPDYWTHISDEVPRIARGLFGLPEKREANFVVGLSMGGYGAFKLALRHPERYAAAASFSGALDAQRRVNGKDQRWVAEMKRVFDSPARMRRNEDELFHLASKLAKKRGVRLPRLYQTCGDKDFLLDENRSFRDHARRLGLDVLYDEDPGYGHAWDYWDVCIQRTIRWFLQPPRRTVKTLISPPLTQ
jgi:putative tributyrin esterase